MPTALKRPCIRRTQLSNGKHRQHHRVGANRGRAAGGGRGRQLRAGAIPEAARPLRHAAHAGRRKRLAFR